MSKYPKGTANSDVNPITEHAGYARYLARKREALHNGEGCRMTLGHNESCHRNLLCYSCKEIVKLVEEVKKLQVLLDRALPAQE